MPLTIAKPPHKTIKAIAAFEAFKGCIALIAASGLLLFLHRDLQDLAIALVEHAHLNPAAHYPSIFIRAVEHFHNVKLTLLALGAAGYSLMRFVEAYGLFREAAWAELFAAVSAAIYIPFEVIELAHRHTWLSAGALIVNIAVVAVMVYALNQRRYSHRRPPQSENIQSIRDNRDP